MLTQRKEQPHCHPTPNKHASTIIITLTHPPEPASVHKAALLAGVRAQHSLEGRLQQVGGGVVRLDATALRQVNSRAHLFGCALRWVGG